MISSKCEVAIDRSIALVMMKFTLGGSLPASKDCRSKDGQHFYIPLGHPWSSSGWSCLTIARLVFDPHGGTLGDNLSLQIQMFIDFSIQSNVILSLHLAIWCLFVVL
ncbi:hypothetical protein ElyMa_004209500 [Elysia marginata]|uniref:Uncharacterized protein n=1 Tax=Elysia marginata TaxID=1093978 RepID=A0AAV4GN59_9GAST|nr:hypothetical protein ElyMa_004209500 [Elysia marginata]